MKMTQLLLYTMQLKCSTFFFQCGAVLLCKRALLLFRTSTTKPGHDATLLQSIQFLCCTSCLLPDTHGNLNYIELK